MAPFADVSLHETTVVDGVSRMRPVPALPVSANGTAELAPGGLHLMLSGPVSALSAGQVVAVDFALRDGTTVRAGFVVR